MIIAFRVKYLALVAVCIPAALHGQTSQLPEARDEVKKEAARKLGAKVTEMEALKGKAEAVTKRLGELAVSGKIPTSADAIELMKKMVEEMSAIRQQLDHVTAEVAGIKSWIAGQKPSEESLAKDVALLKKVKPGGYMQFQYRDTDLKGGATDAFSARRIRVGATVQIDPKTSLKYTTELASGTNQTGSQVREAFMTYDVDPTRKQTDLQISAGQMPMPIGYEIKRSSSDREFPEHSIYNQKLFSGENGRGVQLRYGLGNGVLFELGGWNSLVANDPEQANLAAGPENRLAMTAGLRFFGKKYQFGISGLGGERPKFVSGTGAGMVTHPRVDREFVYIDGAVQGFLHPKIDLRGEAMFGRDRVPVSGTPASAATAKDLSGYHLQVSYRLNASNQLHSRVEQFDPNRDAPGNSVTGYGLAWTHFLNPNAKVTTSHEIFDDASRSGAGVRQQRYQITTIRVQFKF